MQPHQRLGFKTKAAALLSIRDTIRRCQGRGPLVGADADLAFGLLSLHSSVQVKAGTGIAHIYVAPGPSFGHNCFWVKRVDGTCTDFSFHECLTPSSGLKKLTNAARQAVAGQQIAWLRANPANVCGHAGESHADHHPTGFKQIFTAWLGAQPATPALSPTADASCEERFSDPAIAADWQAYHQQHATLRTLCKTCNLRKPRTDDAT